MNVQKIIAQHYNSVALLFSRYGYSGQINAATLNAMAEIHGKPFVMQLKKAVEPNNFVHYRAPVEIGINPDGGDNTPGLTKYEPGVQTNFIEEPVKPDLPPYWDLPANPAGDIMNDVYNGDVPEGTGGIKTTTSTLYPAIEPTPIYEPVPTVQTTSEQSIETPALAAMPVIQAPAKEMSWFEKNQKLVIGAALFIVIIALILRRPTTVLK